VRRLHAGYRLSPLLAFGLTLAAAGAPGACRARDLPPLRADSAPFFTADMAISLDGEGRPALTVSVRVPYPELQWVRLADGYGAGAEIMISLEPHRRDERVFGDAWERRPGVRTFDQTVADSSAVLDSRTFGVPPGRYRARISVSDLYSGLSSSAAEGFEVPDYSMLPVGLSDLELGTVDSSGAFTPVPMRVFGLDVARLAARVSLFDRRTGAWPRTYLLRYRVLDDRGLEMREGQQEASVARSGGQVIVRPDQSGLFLGQYVFEVDLGEGRSRWRVERSFDVEESGPPTGREFTRMLEVLSYIAEPGEVQRLRSLGPEAQAGGWEEFWRRRDPTPGTARNEALIEFFRRVRYAETHFEGFGPGWRSDMGRIYVKYGPPGQIETRSAPAGAAAVEVWTYTSPFRRFIFEDRDGFGRFVLVSPPFE
jgi:GWxTD domain-containing protein